MRIRVDRFRDLNFGRSNGEGLECKGILVEGFMLRAS